MIIARVWIDTCKRQIPERPPFLRYIFSAPERLARIWLTNATQHEAKGIDGRNGKAYRMTMTREIEIAMVGATCRPS